MDAQPTSGVFQLLLLLVCRNVIQITDSLELNPVNGFIFLPNATAKFECVISPYSGVQKWLVNTDLVAECAIVLCDVKNDNHGNYSFTSDTSSGIFTFTITALTLADNGTSIGCHDGMDTKEHNIYVIDTIATTKAITPSKPDINITASDYDGNGGDREVNRDSCHIVLIVLGGVMVKCLIVGGGKDVLKRKEDTSNDRCKRTKLCRQWYSGYNFLLDEETEVYRRRQRRRRN